MKMPARRHCSRCCFDMRPRSWRSLPPAAATNDAVARAAAEGFEHAKYFMKAAATAAMMRTIKMREPFYFAAAAAARLSDGE